jgi:hypothetical protein
MPTKSVHVKLETPAAVSDQAKALAERKAREAAILTLWQEGELSASRAAEELSLPMHDFLDLLAVHGLSAESGPLNLSAIEDARQRVSGRQS